MRSDVKATEKLKRLGIEFSGVADPRYLPAWSPLKRSIAYGVGTAMLGFGVGMLIDGQLFTGAIFAFIIPYLGLFVPAVRRRLSVMPVFAAVAETLAQDNGFSYIASHKPRFDDHFEPSIAHTGIFERQEQIVSGIFDQYEFQSYLYTVRLPFANRIGRVATRVYEVQLPKRYPHIFLMTRRPTGAKYFARYNRYFEDDQRMQLEGNFEDLFISYTHRRTNTDARVILAPNVMETIMRSNEHFSVEILGDKLYVYSPEYVPTVENMAAGFEVLHALLTHFNRLNKTMKFVLPNDNTYPYLRSRMSFGTANLGGKYFNGSLLFIAGWTLWTVVRLWLMHQSRAMTYTSLAVLFVSDAVMVAVLLVYRRKYKNAI